MSNGRVNINDVLASAKKDDAQAVEKLFRGFLSEEESVRDCGYLGAMGIVFKEHSFWCVTPIRVCSLRIKNGGELQFSSAYIEHINSDAFYQPSLVALWIILILVTVCTVGIGLLLIPIIIKIFYRYKKSGVVFWCREGIPIYVFSDRNSLSKAQRIAVQIAEAKRLVGA